MEEPGTITIGPPQSRRLVSIELGGPIIKSETLRIEGDSLFLVDDLRLIAQAKRDPVIEIHTVRQAHIVLCPLIIVVIRPVAVTERIRDPIVAGPFVRRIYVPIPVRIAGRVPVRIGLFIIIIAM